MAKKKYAGMIWTKPEKPDKIEAKGIETVRRDNCDLVKLVINGALEKLLLDFDREGAIEYCKGMINDLLQNRIDLSMLVITKGLSKKIQGFEDEDDKAPGHQNAGDDEGETTAAKKPVKKKQDDVYNSNMAHVKLAERMKKRDKNSDPQVGDRVSYVMIKGAKD